MVERHNGLLRGIVNRIATSLLPAGLKVDFEDVLAEALYVKNTQLEYGGFPPYTAVYG